MVSMKQMILVFSKHSWKKPISFSNWLVQPWSGRLVLTKGKCPNICPFNNLRTHCIQHDPKAGAVLILLRNSKVENLQQLCNELCFISVSNCKRVQKWIYSYWSEKSWLKKRSHNTGWIFDQLKNNWLDTLFNILNFLLCSHENFNG